jgi:DNA-binding transcriptional MerR regulator
MVESTSDPSPDDNQKTSITASSLPMAAEVVAFTGTLASMVHREAALLVEEYGGRSTHSVSGTTTMLVIGEEGWPLESDGGTSQKLQQATQLIAEGNELRITAESDWLHLLGLDERRDEIQRAYTPAMLSRLLDVPVRLIRRWARLGLIRPVRRVCRLPYFTYREVASARRLAELLDEGVAPDRIESSLAELSRTISGTDRSIAQLTLLVQDDKVLLRDARGILNPRTGQRMLDFDAPESLAVFQPDKTVPHDADADTGDGGLVAISIEEARWRQNVKPMGDWNADEWFHEGCRLSEEGEFEAATNAFRNAMSRLAVDHALLRESGPFPEPVPSHPSPDPAEVNFHLADALYRSGHTEAAIERYFCAIEFAPDFIEAWTQLGCLQTDLNQFESADESLLTAIRIHPGNADAILHYAQLMDRMERNDEAIAWWRRYLQHDSRGPWADHARSRVELEAVQTPASADPAGSASPNELV